MDSPNIVISKSTGTRTAGIMLPPGTADSNDFLIILGNTPLAENGRRHVCARALSGCVFIYAAAEIAVCIVEENPFT